jgi:hypothetical protein
MAASYKGTTMIKIFISTVSASKSVIFSLRHTILALALLLQANTLLAAEPEKKDSAVYRTRHFVANLAIYKLRALYSGEYLAQPQLLQRRKN